MTGVSEATCRQAFQDVGDATWALVCFDDDMHMVASDIDFQQAPAFVLANLSNCTVYDGSVLEVEEDGRVFETPAVAVLKPRA